MRVFSWFTPDDYQSIKCLFAKDRDLRNTYAEWLTAACNDVTEYAARTVGNIPKIVIVKSDEFVRYCDTAGIQPSSASLGAFAAVLYAREKEKG